MTIAVYRVRPDGRRVVVKPKRETQGGEPLMTGNWPPCSCPRCRKAKRS